MPNMAGPSQFNSLLSCPWVNIWSMVFFWARKDKIILKGGALVLYFGYCSAADGFSFRQCCGVPAAHVYFFSIYTEICWGIEWGMIAATWKKTEPDARLKECSVETYSSEQTILIIAAMFKMVWKHGATYWFSSWFSSMLISNIMVFTLHGDKYSEYFKVDLSIFQESITYFDRIVFAFSISGPSMS